MKISLAQQTPPYSNSPALKQHPLNLQLSGWASFNSFKLHRSTLALKCLLSLPFKARYVAFELPCRDLPGNELVNLLKRTPSSLWLEEVQVVPTKNRDAAEDEGRFGSQVCLIRVEDEWQDKFPHGKTLDLLGDSMPWKAGVPKGVPKKKTLEIGYTKVVNQD
jgi:hypothetical protein